MCRCVQCGKVIDYVIVSAMYYGTQYMLRLLAGSEVESNLRNVKNDGSALGITKWAPTWARRSLGKSIMQILSLLRFKILEEIFLWACI